MLFNDIVQLGHHMSTSNWADASWYYDLKIGMTWHTEVISKVNYEIYMIHVSGRPLPVSNYTRTARRISHISTKEFCSLPHLGVREGNISLFWLVTIEDVRKVRYQIQNDIPVEFWRYLSSFIGKYSC